MTTSRPYQAPRLRGLPLIAVMILVWVVGDVFAADSKTPAWSASPAYRVLVEVPPADLQGRPSDDMIASLDVDFEALLSRQQIDGKVDLSSLRVHRFNSATGEAQVFDPSVPPAVGLDHPCRFDDNVLPEEYPGGTQRPSNTADGRVRAVMRPRKGRLFNRLVDPSEGRVVWAHTQHGNTPTHYAVYFDVEDLDAPPQPSPAPWLGDADVLRRAEGESLAGFSHFVTTTADLNGDGLFDLIASEEKGSLMWLPNLGKPGEPVFKGAHILTDEEGPIDTGFYGAPFVIDWDNDGRLDILVGASHDTIVWWKNVGDTGEESIKLAFRGFVMVDGEKMQVPKTPVDGDPRGIFKNDYYDKPWIGDWDGDGLPDILTGGYITGRIFHYRATRRDRDGVPTLTYVGELQADGEPIDTAWGAAPTAHDVDGDGDLDLVTGSWWWSGLKRARQEGEADYLMYFRNDGTPGQPQLTRAPFPYSGKFPRSALARASFEDWDNDGRDDLIVCDGSGVRLCMNQGTAQSPQWSMPGEELTLPWAFVRGLTLTGSWVDFNGDDSRETLVVTSIQRLEGTFRDPKVRPVARVTVDGKPVVHPGPGYGDPYAYLVPADWDKDGAADILWGTHQGEMFFHRGVPAEKGYNFAPGEKLMLTNGEPLKVGPEIAASPKDAKDFTVLQGSRIVHLITDFDGDGIDDLVVSETYGNLWVFLNTRQGGVDTLRPGVKVNAMKGRTWAIGQLDYNQDGRPDLLTSSSSIDPGDVWINQSRPGKPALDDPIKPLGLPYMFWGPRFRSVDWNQDGDDDLLVKSEFLTFWVERSFLDHGYQNAEIVSPAGRGGTPIAKRDE